MIETVNRQTDHRQTSGISCSRMVVNFYITSILPSTYLGCTIRGGFDPLTLPEASKDLQVPSGLSMPSFMNCTDVFGLRSRLTPPTRAESHWPWRMALKAFSRANRLEEQAVSMAVLGPDGGITRRKVGEQALLVIFLSISTI